MKCHVILNGFSQMYEKHCGQINGFIINHCIKMEKGNTYIICDEKSDGDDRIRLADLAPTSSVVFILVRDAITEVMADALTEKVTEDGLYLLAGSYSGEELAVRIAKRKHMPSATGVLALGQNEEDIQIQKMVYSNHMMASFQLEQASMSFISIAKGAEEITPQIEKKHILEIYYDKNNQWENIIEVVNKIEALAESGLQDAAQVVIGGKGLGNKAGCEWLQEQSEKINAEYGISRPVAMNAWASMERLVGVSGNMIHPDICIVVASSGAPAFYSGIEKSKLIIAFNKDEKAPIIKKSDVAVIGDYREITEKLIEIFEKEKSDADR